MLSVPQLAEASPWDDLWTTKDQQGQKAWQNNQPDEASQLFEDPAWKASAQYKNGDFQGSSETLKQHVTTEAGNTADNHYNLGNALAKQQDFPGALDAYERALKLNPDMEDAKKNHSIVKQIEKQQQEQQGDGENKDGEPQDSDDKNNNEKDKNDEQQDDNNASEQDGDNQDSESQKSEQENQDQSEQKKNGSDQESDSENEQDQQSQQQSGEENDEEKDSEQSQMQSEEDQNKEEADSKEQQASAADIQESNLNKEDQQALEQWLRRIPDDPGGLLRRKFSQESKLRRNQPVEDKQW